MPKSQPISLRLDPSVLREVQALAKHLQRPASTLIQTLINEGIRQRKCPGVSFTEGPAGRRATVAGSGVDVWEVIRVFRTCGEDRAALARALPHLSRPQLDAALRYARCYPKEIAEWIARAEAAEAEVGDLSPLVRSYPA